MPLLSFYSKQKKKKKKKKSGEWNRLSKPMQRMCSIRVFKPKGWLGFLEEFLDAFPIF